ncbi:MAG TPA: GDSL-type esterase/lipase family protein [Ktedonobacterales bacterium]
MRIVFLGDSLTEGRDGASYLAVLRRRAAEEAAPRGVELVNAGVGGDTVLNLLRRVPVDVVPLAPAWVVVLIGVNDATTALARRRPPTMRTLATRRYFQREKHIRGAVTPARYTDGLRLLVETLRARTAARIALCTPPTIGESLAARSWRLLDQYAAAVRLVADERGCALIEVHAAFARALAALPPRPLATRLLGPLRARALPSGDFEAIARARGLTYTYDGVHLTAAGAALVAETLYAWLASRAPIA